MTDDSYASLDQMHGWARAIMRRDPDERISTLLRRWYVTPRSPAQNVYLHEILRSDQDRALHDHPWDNSSYLISGRYIEHTPEGQILCVAGDHVVRPASALHRLELLDGNPVLSLFITGPKIRDWGFACPEGWVHWRDFHCRRDQPETAVA